MNEQANIEKNVKKRTVFKRCKQPELIERMGFQWGRVPFDPADQGHLVATFLQGAADPDHALIEAQVVCYRENDSFQNVMGRYKIGICPNI